MGSRTEQGQEDGASVAVVFWPWAADAAALATLRDVIHGLPPNLQPLLPGTAASAELRAALPVAERNRITIANFETERLADLLAAAVASHPAAALAIVADAGQLPADWLSRLWTVAHADDTIVAATAYPEGVALGSANCSDRTVRANALPQRLPVPRVLVPSPTGCLIRRSALDLIGRFDRQLSHPWALLADFAARGRELGLSCALALPIDTSERPSALLPCPPEELAALDHRHRWLAAARADEQALDVGVLRRSLILSHACRRAISVTVDARSLGSGFGGTQTYTGSLLLALARSEALAVRAVLAGEPDTELLDQLTAAGVEVVQYEDAANGRLDRTDVVHRPQQVFTASDLRLMQLLGERLVVTHMDLIAYRAPTYHESVDAWRSYRRVTRLALASADRVLFFSEHARRDAIAEELIAEDRSTVAGIGVEASLLNAPRRRPGRIPPDTELLLMLGADYAHKNRPFAIKLLHELRRRHGWSGVLVLAGAHVAHGSSARTERELLANAPELAAAVVDLGPVSEAEKRWLMDAAVAHLAPSAYEGFGLAPLEAAAAGRPCLYASCSSLQELIDPAAATIVPWDAAASADEVIELLRPGPAREAHMRHLTSALRAHTWPQVLPRIVLAYEEALASPYRGAVPRSWEELQREELVASLHAAHEDLLARVRESLALIDARDPLLSPTQQRALLRVARRRWLRGPLLGPLGLLGGGRREA